MPVTRNQSNAAANAKSNAIATDTSGTRETSERGETSTETEPSRRDSPENCSICLGPFNNKSFTSSCAHSFCFVCLKQWSKVKAECPLCKQPFTSIFHNIRSNDSYDIYELPPLNPPRQIDYSYFYNYVGGNLATFAPTHHYLSLPQPSLDADLTLSNFSRFQFRHRRYDRYLNPLHPVHGEHQYSYSSSSFNPSNHVSAASWPRGAEDFRLRVYRHDMGPPAIILGCENSTYRLTPAMVAASAHRMQRIMPWLTRELWVLLRSHQCVRLAISMIQPLLSQVTIDSDYFSERISPLIGQRALQFIQEFVAFTNSALNMQAFDRKAMYRRRLARFLTEENTSSSSSDDDDDVVEVTDVSPDVQAPSVIATSNTSTSLQRAGWDSPTPGPSWETMDTRIGGPQIEGDRVSISSESDDPVFRPDLIESDSENSKQGSDIVFVKYDKPWNERSPIKLSSDSEGDRWGRKRKKAKHKRKRKEIPDLHVASAKKSKGHKSSKSKSKEKVRTSKASSEDEIQASNTHKRAHSMSSEKQKRKKHKRSKDRNDDNMGHDRDRELVDRLFVEAFTQQQNLRAACEGEDASIPCSSKSKEKNAGKSSGKERHRRKKKKKNQIRDSVSPSVLPSYKKHHSGHKKSLDKSNHEPERRRRQHMRAARDNAASGYSSRTESLERELQVPRNQPLPPSNVDHSMASTFQTSYLTRTDTVQHIPLNLWVSTWPSLPVSHTFPAPPTSSFPPPSLPQPLASSSLPNHNLNHSLSEHNSSAVNSQTISSESESSSDSDTDDSPGKSVSPLPNSTRTKQWLDANFSDVRRQPATSSMLQTISAVPNTRNWCIENITGQNNISTVLSDDVVSIASGDEDILVCSSASSTKSDSDEVKVIESCDLPVNTVSDVDQASCSETPGGLKHTVRDNAGRHSIPIQDQENGTKSCSLSNDNLSPPSCSSFQPFKLHRKSAISKQSVNPFFSSMAHSSDDDGTGDDDISTKPQSSDPEKIKSVESLPNSIHDAVRTPSDHEFKAASTLSSRLESSASPRPIIFPPTQSCIFESSLKGKSNTPIPASGGGNSLCMHSGDHVTPSSFSLSSSTSEPPVFGGLPPLQPPTTAPVSSILSSSLSYLPYSPLSMSTSLSSILPQSIPFGVPQPPAPPSLPLHFPFPPIQPLMPGPSTLYPAVYVSYSQTAQMATTVSSNSLSSGLDSKPSFPPLISANRFTLEAQNNQAECLVEAAVDGTDTNTSDETTITSTCPQNSFAALLNPESTSSKAAELSLSEDTFMLSQKVPTSDKPVPSVQLQDLGDTEEFKESCIKSIRDFLEVENDSNNCSSTCGTALSTDERTAELTPGPNRLTVAETNTPENSPHSGCDIPAPVLDNDVNSQHFGENDNNMEQNLME